MTTYQDRPWLAQLNEAQRAPVQPPPSVLHAFRDAVRRAPERVALAYFDGRLTYAETDALSDGLAAHLAARGFARGDRAAVMLQNTPQFVIAVLGVWKAGGIVVPANPMYKSGEMTHLLTDAEATAVICARDTWDAFLRETAFGVPSVRIALTTDERELQTRDDTRVFPGARHTTGAGAQPGTRTGAHPGSNAGAHDETETEANAGARPGTRTSAHPGANAGTHDETETEANAGARPGTMTGAHPGANAGARTGANAGARDETRARKGARAQAGDEDLLTVARAAAATAPAAQPPATPLPTADDIALISYTSGTSGRPKGAMNTFGNLTHNAERQRVGLGLPDGSTYFVLAPLFHITGMVSEFSSCLANAGTLALAYRFEPGVVLDAFLEHRPAYTVGPSTAFMALMAHPKASRDHFASFRTIASGGAPVPPALVERFRAEFGPYLHNGYGLTECSAPCASVPPGKEAPVDPASGTLAVGVPGPETMIRIIDDNGRDVPFGEHGEIAVRGPQVVPGYWRRPDATAEGLPDGELRTGDTGFMDTDGWLYVVDRKKDMINASGFKVWPREVEDVLYTHPAVREAAVVGVPDAYRGETVKAYVSLRPGAAPDPAELAGWCRDRLAVYKYPRQVEILPDLPKTASGKILRRELRDRARHS
ncbi:AMP-binding protein [Streptomyces sp. NPDC003077]|uniref:class I adenylate-forming enzyme family protein n=1 Tax=Streptomyces sp. NPDC003077 TaxID=3154443 RepID=UPI0033A8E8A0